MLRLILFRHAKTEAGDETVKDVDRNLTTRGRSDATTMGKLLQDKGFVPDIIIASTAARAAQTLQLAYAAWPSMPRIRRMPNVYGLMAGDYIEFIRNEGGEAKVLMVVGHNPAMERSASRLAKTAEDPDQLKRLRNGMQTADVAVIDFDVERWSTIGAGVGHLVAFLAPRDA